MGLATPLSARLWAFRRRGEMPAPTHYPHQSPSEGERLDSPIGRTARSSRVSPSLQHGHTLTDRDQVDDVPGLPSTSAATIRSVPKNRIPSPRRQQPLYQGSLASCRSPPVRVRPSRSQPSGFATSPMRPMRRNGRSRTGWLLHEARVPRLTGLLPARGSHPHFFRSRMVAARRAEGSRGTASTRLRSVEGGPGWKDVPWMVARNTRWYVAERLVQNGQSPLRRAPPGT